MANINYTKPNKLEDFSVWCSKKYPLWCKSNFPFIEDTFEALDTYELICKIVQYLNETNQNLNTTEDNVQNIYNFVTNYFDNLDVQNEINNKLDSMISSGELQTLLTEQYNSLRNDVNSQISNQNAHINIIDNKVNSVSSGSPAGVYDTLEDLMQENPSHDKIYVVKEDGEWYYWDSSINQWNNGGVYQATVQYIDNTLEIKNSPSDSKSVGNRINKLFYNNNLFDKNNIIDNKYYDISGNLVDDNNYMMSNIIYLKQNERISIYEQEDENVLKLAKSSAIKYIVILTNNGNFNERKVLSNYHYTPDSDILCRIIIDKSLLNYPSNYLNLTIKNKIPFLNNEFNFIDINNYEIKDMNKKLSNLQQYNYFNKENIIDNYYIDALNFLIYNESYIITNIIPVKIGDVIKSSKSFSHVLKYDIDGNFIERVTTTNNFTSDIEGFVRFNINKSNLNLDSLIISKNVDITKYYPYGYIIENEKNYIEKIDNNNYIIHFKNFNVTLFKTVNNNSNNWNLKEIKNNNNIIVPSGTDIIGPIKINDNDFIGGLHGYETTKNIILSIDGVVYNIEEIPETLYFNNLLITLISDIKDISDLSIAFERYVNIEIYNNKIHIVNSYKTLKELILNRATNGGLIACRNDIIKSIKFNNKFFESAPTEEVHIGSNKNTNATISTIYGSITVNNIKGYDNENYSGFLAVFSNENPIRNKIYFDTYKSGNYNMNVNEIILGEFEYILN